MANLVVVVEEDPDQGFLVCEFLRQRGYRPTLVTSGEAALTLALEHNVTAMIAEVGLGNGITGLELCTRMHERAPEVPVIMLTATTDFDTVVLALRAGAYDFVAKPIVPEDLTAAVARAVDHANLRAEVGHLRLQLYANKPVHGLIGTSAPLAAAVEVARRVATSDASVLVTGESGTGKELISRAIHDLGPRRDRPFVAINCAAVPANLLESELFGHVKGAFTDAKRNRPGLFLQAQGGTLFLDEVGEMPLEMQAKLLRVLQERRVRAIGSDDEVAVDCRLVCATNRDLESDVETGRFREDLFYRVNVVGIHVPPLRERGSDVLEIAHHFLARIAGRSERRVRTINVEACRRLLDYDWPGNVRELENCMERGVALCHSEELGIDDLPEKIRKYTAHRVFIEDNDGEGLLSLSEMEQRYVRRVLAAVAGNKSQAARVLGIDRRSLYRRLDATASPVDGAA